MKIIVAQTAGFCMGVRRAVDLAVDTAASTRRRIHTLGPLIHNRQTMDMLRGRGVRELGPDSRPRTDEPVLVRAHGIPPGREGEYRRKGHPVIDGTCPKVKTVHRVITKYRDRGYAVIIAGDAGHAEVIGLQGYAGPDAHLVRQPEDIAALPDHAKVCLVAQTTYDKGLFDRIGDAVRTRYADADVTVKRTICSATDKRQDETIRLSGQVDAMVVVGGKHSANTQRLAEISARHAPTQHIETEDEIDWNLFRGCAAVGVTAGASTPNWMIQRVVDQLHYLDQTATKSVKGMGWRGSDLLANLNIFAALGGTAMYYASAYLQGYPFHWSGGAVAFLYLFSMYLWNGLANVENTRHLGLSRNLFYSAHRTGLQALTLACITAMLALARYRGPLLLWLMLLSTVVGTVYHVSIVPGALRRFVRYGKLRDIPTSKDLFIALAWAVVITFIPHAAAGRIRIGPFSVLFFLWMFFLAYVRSVMVDLKDIEGDRIMGRETLVTILGEKRTRRGITTLLIILFLAIVGVAVTLFLPLQLVPGARVVQYLCQTPALLYAWLFMKWSHRITEQHSGLYGLVGDGQFLVAGLGAWVASVVL